MPVIFNRAAAGCLSLLALILTAVPSAAENGIKVGSLEVYPTFECAGLRLAYSGDSDSNAVAGVKYRLKGAAAWREAQPLCRIKDNRFAGSIFFLTPGSTYEVAVTVSDPAGVDIAGKTALFSTRKELFPAGPGGKEYRVDPKGDDANKGTAASPFCTIQHAASVVQPGDIVLVNPGLYREDVEITVSGREEAYILFKAASSGAVITGADERYDTPRDKSAAGGALWQPAEGEVYRTNPGYQTRFAAVNGVRLYHYITREEFEEFICGEPGGWYQDEATHELYLRLSTGADLNTEVIQIAARDAGFHLKGARYILIEGFEIGNCGRQTGGSGVHLDGASWCVVRNSSIHGMNSCVELSGGASCEGNLIESCRLWDTSIQHWPWAMTKAHDEEGGGVMSTGGRGNVVRSCTIDGTFDGLAPSYWDSLWNESYNCDWDVHDNRIINTRDDIIEPEGPCVNFRFWNNVCHDLFVGVSLAPINVGPTYVLYNSIYELKFKNIKYGDRAAGTCYVYHNTIYSGRTLHNLLQLTQPPASQVYRNNIFFANSYAISASERPRVKEDIDYDDWYSSDDQWFNSYTGTNKKRLFQFGRENLYTLESLQNALGWEIHGLNADPLFINPAAGDFHLTPKSPCIDRGQVLPNINDNYSGAAPDLGAFEWGGKSNGEFPLGSRWY